MTYDDSASDMYIDPRGHLVERIDMGGQQVHVHYRDIPESDITTVHGLRVTTPLRTVIDIASDGDAENPGAQMLCGLLMRMKGAA